MSSEIEFEVSALLRAMQNAMDWQIEEHGEDWADDDEMWASFFDDLSESVACGYTGNIGSENIDQVVKESIQELDGREDWRLDILKEAQVYQKRWEDEDNSRGS